MYVQAKNEKRWKRVFRIIFKAISSFLPGLVSEQTSKMAEAWKAVCIWSRSSRAWHGLPVVAPGAIFPKQSVSRNISLGSRTWKYPGHLLFVLPGVSTSLTVLSPCSSGCNTPPMPRPPGMPLLLQHVTSDRGHVFYSPPFPTWRRGPGIGWLTGTYGWNSKGDNAGLQHCLASSPCKRTSDEHCPDS